jgi:pyruvate dehydrogenase E2 component (dihydrolipoamide acetyltransferase)
VSEAAKGQTTVAELSRAQATIGRRAAEAKATIPDFSVTADLDMARAAPLADPVPLAVRACALALRDLPAVNASYRDARLELHGRVNIGVGLPSPDSLVFPTVFDADGKRLPEIEAELLELAERARAGALTPPQLAGGTFSVLGLGAVGTAIINPPQAAVLAVSPLRDAPAVRDGAVVPARLATLTLSCDARVLYGPQAAAFLARVRELLVAADPSVL